MQIFMLNQLSTQMWNSLSRIGPIGQIDRPCEGFPSSSLLLLHEKRVDAIELDPLALTQLTHNS